MAERPTVVAPTDPEFVRWYPCDISPEGAQHAWEPRELGVYVHVPFCSSICKCCAYNRIVARPDTIAAYVQAVRNEVQLYSERGVFANRRLVTVYFGGGTPTILSPAQFDAILSSIASVCTAVAGCEISMEGNPASVTKQHVRELLNAGMNRLSVGVQSFNDTFLRLLGRQHDANTALRAIDDARDAGCESLGIDLMYNLPGQTLPQWERDVDRAIRLRVDHVSAYALELVPGTTLHREHGTTSDTTAVQRRELAVAGANRFLASGYDQYAVYDFALPGKRCVYEFRHWAAPQMEWIGLGAGAFSFIDDLIYVNILPPSRYICAVTRKRLPILAASNLSAREHMARYVVMGVKCLRVPCTPFEVRFGFRLESVFADEIARLRRDGLAVLAHGELVLTESGILDVDRVTMEFFTKATRGLPQPCEDQMRLWIAPCETG
ncbi:MAG: radical SAM family heme chaperone HemW [Planctomycetota bacterium]